MILDRNLEKRNSPRTRNTISKKRLFSDLQFLLKVTDSFKQKQ